VALPSGAKDWGPDRIIAEINERIKLKAQLVGWLYPPIVQGEIDELKALYTDKGLGFKNESRPEA